MTILALGRLTTVARVVARHPDLRDRIDDIVVLGGRRLEAEPGVGTDGKILPDANLAADMDAVRTILESGMPLTPAPTDLALTVAITPADLDALAARGGAARRLALRDDSFRGSGQDVPRLVVSGALDSPYRARFCFATTPEAKAGLLAALPGGP